MWCDANLSLVALAAETLDLLPDELASGPINVTSDDPSTPTADLSDDASLDILRRLREVARQAPPQQYGDIGIDTSDGFEQWRVLGPRSVNAARGVALAWVASFDSHWGHEDVIRACVAAREGFG